MSPLERRGRLGRKTELKRGEGPKANPETTRAWQRRSAKPLPARSEKRREDMELDRIPFVVATLAGRPDCEIELHWCCQLRAVDVNELQRGPMRTACWLDPAKVTTACRACHDWLGLHPDWAYRHGHQLAHAAKPADFERAALVRATELPGKLCRPDCATDHRL